MFIFFRFNIVLCRCKRDAGSSDELLPCGTSTSTSTTTATSTTTTEGHPHPDDELSSSSGMYCYVYDHRGERLIHSHTNSRPSPTQAPLALDQNSLSSPLISSPSNEEASCQSDGYLEPEDQPLNQESENHYQTIDDEMTDTYDDVE